MRSTDDTYFDGPHSRQHNDNLQRNSVFPMLNKTGNYGHVEGNRSNWDNGSDLASNISGDSMRPNGVNQFQQSRQLAHSRPYEPMELDGDELNVTVFSRKNIAGQAKANNQGPKPDNRNGPGYPGNAQPPESQYPAQNRPAAAVQPEQFNNPLRQSLDQSQTSNRQLPPRPQNQPPPSQYAQPSYQPIQQQSYRPQPPTQSPVTSPYNPPSTQQPPIRPQQPQPNDYQQASRPQPQGPPRPQYAPQPVAQSPLGVRYQENSSTPQNGAFRTGNTFQRPNV